MIDKIVPFLKEVRIEIFRVTWPNKQEIIAGTTIVIIISLILASFIGFIDINLSKIIQFVLK